jgi:hypothetical protein
MGLIDSLELLRAFDLDLEGPATINDEAYQLTKKTLEKYSARELEMTCTRKGLCGQICYYPPAWRDTSIGNCWDDTL